MRFEPSTVKGFQDYFPPESLKREKIRKTAEKYFKLYGFLPVETPIIEFDELMRSESLNQTNEDEAVAERFRLRDRGGRNLGLRYEFTFQLARIFRQNPNLKLPFRRYQIGSNFRDEPIRTGRTRQFTQCDADIVGDQSIEADAECIALMSDILKELKIKPEIQINNRKLLNSIIESVEMRQSRQVLRELDKLEKIGEDEVKINLKQYASPNQIVTLFKLMEKDLSFFKENAFDGSEELEKLIRKLKQYGVEAKFKPNMVRGFSYYTGNVFEFVANKKVIAAGGRYDNEVGKFSGKEIPAVGVSFSIEALTGICEEELKNLKTSISPKAVLISIEEDKEAINLAKKLRKNNISCTISFNKPGKALEYANSYKTPYAIFIGSEELKKKKYKVKEMESGKESLISEKQLINKLKK